MASSMKCGVRFSIPIDKAEKSMRLFAKEVLPFVQSLKVQEV